MRPGAKRRDHRRRSPGWRIRLRCLNEARREAPGITEDKDGKLASVPNTASMRPGAKRRDHASAGASACGEVSMLQ